MRRGMILLFALPLLAHETYLMPGKFRVEPGETLALSIHTSDGFPASESPTDPARIAGARLSDGTPVDGWRILGPATHTAVRIGGRGSIYAVASTRPRFIELAAEKFEAYLKGEGLDAVSRWRASNGESDKPGREIYSKHAKALIVSGAADAGWSKHAGLAIEFVPDNDPSAVRPGGTLTARLLFRGQPLAGAKVESAWVTGAESGAGPTAVTDASGRFTVKLDKAAKWLLHAVTMERRADRAEADWESFWASLVFETAAH